MPSKVFELINLEMIRQRDTIELIASENFVSDDVMRAVGSCLTNKYAEGYPGHRYYGGCDRVDEIEEYARYLYKKLFDESYHVNVQPHSGSNANIAAYMAVLKPGDTVLAMDLTCGGHLSHGSPVNISGKVFNFHKYGVDEDGFLNYGELEEKAHECRPRLIVAGASSYPRAIDFERIERIAREVNALFMVDMAHIAGLIATGFHESPFGLADIVTTTTHKTLRGPRGGMIFCRPELAKKVDSAVFPGTQGGPLMHVIAGKAVAAEEALQNSYRDYISAVVRNASAMASYFKINGYDVVTGGTDTHLFVLDFSRTHPTLTGRELQDALDNHGITLNKNCVPNERRSPADTSGVRIGTPAMTTKGFSLKDFITTAMRINNIVKSLAK